MKAAKKAAPRLTGLAAEVDRAHRTHKPGQHPVAFRYKGRVYRPAGRGK